jgi:uncharacterized protein YaaR (DUF327 family)
MNTIDVDQIWMRGKMNPCSNYVLYAKVHSKYIQPIHDNLTELSKLLRKSKKFSRLATANQKRIYSWLDYVDNMNSDGLNELLEKEYSVVEFLMKVDEIRGRDTNKSVDRSGDRL